MRAEQYALVKALFAELCDLPLPQRAEHLRQRTDDAEVIEFVCSLLEQSQTPVAQIAATVHNAMNLVATEELRNGDLLGAWKIISPIGQGGMGSLFLVERNDGHFRQRAALKVAAFAIIAKLDPQVAANLSRPRMNYALFLLQIGRLDEAQPMLLAYYQLEKGKSADNKVLLAEAVQALLRCAIAKKDMVQAQQYFNELTPLRAHLRATDATTQSSVDALMLAAQGKIKEAFAAFEVAQVSYLKTFGTHDARYWIMQLDRAELLSVQTDPALRKQARVLAGAIAVQLRQSMAPEANEFKRVARLLKMPMTL